VEKDVNLDVSNRTKIWLDMDTDDTGGGSEWEVWRTRSTDITVSLADRCAYANNNNLDRFMCTHANAFGSSANGIETFSRRNPDSTSVNLRDNVYHFAVNAWPLTRRGVKVYNFYQLVNTNMPAQLHEMAFIDYCPTDAVYLGSASHRHNQALSQVHALQVHYGHAAYTPQSSVTVIVDNSSGNFSASSNWWTGSYGSPYGSNYHVRATAAVSDQAQWSYSLANSGSYTVSAWWTDGSNRASSATYSITRSGGTSTVSVNQRVNGGKWNTLGSYTINSGSNNVKLSCWTTSGDYVIADAVKIAN
jgi:hypothetical protein